MNAHHMNRVYLMAVALECNFKVNPKGRYIVFMDNAEIYELTISFEQFTQKDYFELRNHLSNIIQTMKEG